MSQHELDVETIYHACDNLIEYWEEYCPDMPWGEMRRVVNEYLDTCERHEGEAES